MSKHSKIFKGKLSFNQADISRAKLGVDYSGISMAIPDDYAEYKKQFESTKDWLSFGMFGNDPKFVPSVALSDVTPKPEDFVEVPFRLLSATTVGAGSWKATDFSDVAVLKASRGKLEGKPLYKDHETDLDNWVGLVKGIKWTESFLNDDGVKVPAGIDGIVAIDAKTNPKVARGVLMGSIFSNSVTVEFDWKMSHSFEDEYEFYRKVGTFGADGEMIRRVVTEIYNYHESSLVWLGADPFAKAITQEGSLKHIDVGSISYEKESDEVKEKFKKNKTYSVKHNLDKGVLSLTGKKAPAPRTKSKAIPMEKLIAALTKKLGLDASKKYTQDELIAELAKISLADSIVQSQVALATSYQAAALEAAKKKDDTITEVDMEEFAKTHTLVANTDVDQAVADAAEVITLKTEKKGLETKISGLEADATIGKEYIKMQREEAVRLYKLSAGDKTDDAVVALFNKATPKEVTGLLSQYTKNATHKFSGKCSSCGSTDFEFKSTVTGETTKEEDVTIEEVGVASLHAKYDNPSWDLRRKKGE